MVRKLRQSAEKKTPAAKKKTGVTILSPVPKRKQDKRKKTNKLGQMINHLTSLYVFSEANATFVERTPSPGDV